MDYVLRICSEGHLFCGSMAVRRKTTQVVRFKISIAANSRQSEAGSDLVDAILLADGVEFPVHSLILSIRSNFFKVFFRSFLSNKVEMAGNVVEEEGKKKTSKKRRQPTKEEIVPNVFKIDQDPKVLEKILQFIYGDKQCV